MNNITVIENIGLLATAKGSKPLKGELQGELDLKKDVCVVIRDGIIESVQKDVVIKDAKRIDACGCLVTPGIVDPHTHAVFAGYRQHEIELKLKGASYIDILNAGGGILDTVKKTRKASFDELYSKTISHLDEMLSYGITTCEIKSGYGLNLEDELKQLEVAKKANNSHYVDIVNTFMGAHALPFEFSNKKEYVDYLCEVVIPEVANRNLAAFCDCFCEESVYNIEESERVLKSARAHGMGIKIHTDEIAAIGGSILAGNMKAVSAEHLIEIDDAGIKSLAKNDVIAVLLPMTSLYLNKEYAPARKMIESNVSVAIGSDFNPGSCPSYDAQLAMTLGYLKYRMTPKEVLNAVTLNAAYAIGLGDRKGAIEEGKDADLIIWDASDIEMLCYRFGTNMVKKVIKSGECVISR